MKISKIFSERLFFWTTLLTLFEIICKINGKSDNTGARGIMLRSINLIRILERNGSAITVICETCVYLDHLADYINVKQAKDNVDAMARFANYNPFSRLNCELQNSHRSCKVVNVARNNDLWMVNLKRPQHPRNDVATKLRSWSFISFFFSNFPVFLLPPSSTTSARKSFQSTSPDYPPDSRLRFKFDNILINGSH